MTTDLDIVNRAASRIGQSTVVAAAMTDQYDATMRMVCFLGGLIGGGAFTACLRMAYDSFVNAQKLSKDQSHGIV